MPTSVFPTSSKSLDTLFYIGTVFFFFFYRKYLKDKGLSFPKLNQIYGLLYPRKFILNLARSCFQSKRIKERRSSVS